ncbi:hypothetical protein CKO11_12005 [Rhodobacter sp. TJ_12]|uniref:hypothetical protein n=1 Tax=Rhodobacter sp. TJ_12 TaxID=2029399 RepID=UPI001CC18632|nr:hypothetical protein [Rhodobacter sp. TJ_12]MBZ4023180.1 hypothetical protein [Rhodobacter sp. TJ_12]
MISKATLILPLALAATLAGCGPATQDPTPQDPMPVPHLTPPVSQDGALEAREPDTCHAIDYASALGQPAAIIPTLGITQPINVVEWRGIEPQEYNAQRIVFRLDASGNIFNIDCG